MARAQARATTDHEEIRRWAEERGATPACVRGTGSEDDIGMLRLDFPGYSGEGSLQPITWEEWFRKFDERGLALLHQNETARGVKSNFNKLIARETAEHRAQGDRKYSRRHPERGRSEHAGARRTAGRTRTKTSRSRSAKPAARSRKTAQRPPISARRRATSGGRRAEKRQGRSGSATRQGSASSRSRRGGSSRGARVLTNRDEIRRWAEERGATPACVRGTGGGRDVGMIRLDFPGFSGARSLEPVDWDEWLKAFEDSNLALLVQDTTARGQRSNFNKLVGRETAEARQRGVSGASRRHPERASKSSARGRKSEATAKPSRGSSRAKRTQSVRGRTTSRRKAA